VDVRVLAATARDLERDTEGGRFREDLYYRLNVVRIHIPPLRERPQDIEPLVAALLDRAVKRSGRAVTLSPDALTAIGARAWPGNVREMENAIERATVLSADGVIGAEAFEAGGQAAGPLAGTAPSASIRPSAHPPLRLADAVEAAEREAIRAALDAAGGSRAAAAKQLGISQRTLFYKLKKLGLN
jgi:DNA-binding NtrC family response regulator